MFMPLYRILTIVLLVTLVSCQEDDFDAPRASFDVYYGTPDDVAAGNLQVIIPAPNAINSNGLIIYKNEPLIFINTGAGTHFSLWPGAGNNDYYQDSRASQGINFPLDEEISYAYDENGVYNLIMWATSLEPNGSTWSRDSVYYIVEVIDKPE